MRRTIPISVSLKRSTLEKLDALARADGRSRSGMVRRLIDITPDPVERVVAPAQEDSATVTNREEEHRQ